MSLPQRNGKLIEIDIHGSHYNHLIIIYDYSSIGIILYSQMYTIIILKRSILKSEFDAWLLCIPGPLSITWPYNSVKKMRLQLSIKGWLKLCLKVLINRKDQIINSPVICKAFLLSGFITFICSKTWVTPFSVLRGSSSFTSIYSYSLAICQVLSLVLC